MQQSRWEETLKPFFVKNLENMHGDERDDIFISTVYSPDVETGVVNVIVWPKVFERIRKNVMSARLMAVWGRLQREGIVIHVVAEILQDRFSLLCDLNDPE